MSSFDSSKVVVLVTGGNTGIGYEIVKKLANDHASSHHILLGTRSLQNGKSALESLGSPSNVEAVQIDISDDVSIDKLYADIEATYGKLDILINNSGTAGRDMGPVEGHGFQPEGVSLREVYTHVFNVNVVSTAVLTDKLVPLLRKSALPKVIFVSSGLGSIAALLEGKYPVVPCPWYSSSKSAINYHAAYYSRLFPEWKVNAVCPGLNATGLNAVPLSDATHPRNGAVRVAELVAEGKEGQTGTFSNKKGPQPW